MLSKVKALAAEHDVDVATDRCLVIGCNVDVDRSELARSAPRLDWLASAVSVDELNLAVDYTLAIVFITAREVDKRLAGQLLGRLRDGVARRTLVHDPESIFSTRELLALGYIGSGAAHRADRVFLHNPEEFFSRREWNTAEDWAKPENFKRFRW